MGIGPVPAIKAALKSASKSLQDMKLIEVFRTVSITYIHTFIHTYVLLVKGMLDFICVIRHKLTTFTIIDKVPIFFFSWK